MIVLMLVSIAFLVSAIQLPKALRKESFSSSVEKMVNKLSSAQEVMIDYKADLALVLTFNEQGLTCTFTPKRKVPSSLVKKLNKDPVLPEIGALFWNGQSVSHLELNFSSDEHRYPHGILTLKGASEQKLFLHGHPGEIDKHPSVKEQWYETIVSIYPEEVRSFT